MDPHEARRTTSAGVYGVEILTPLVRTYGSDAGDWVLNVNDN